MRSNCSNTVRILRFHAASSSIEHPDPDFLPAKRPFSVLLPWGNPLFSTPTLLHPQFPPSLSISVQPGANSWENLRAGTIIGFSCYIYEAVSSSIALGKLWIIHWGTFLRSGAEILTSVLRLASCEVRFLVECKEIPFAFTCKFCSRFTIVIYLLWSYCSPSGTIIANFYEISMLPFCGI
jgi:hypothetical protein